MVRHVHEFDDPERFVAGTVGAPGSRTFFLQARAGTRVTSVVAEKRQVAILAERLNDLLDEVARRGDEASVSAAPSGGAEDSGGSPSDTAPLDTPLDEEFRVGTMSLSWDDEVKRVVIECYADDDDGSESDEQTGSGSVLRVRITGAYARSFAVRALAVVAAGRPPCPFCEGPLEPEGHICPRANGYRR